MAQQPDVGQLQMQLSYKQGLCIFMLAWTNKTYFHFFLSYIFKKECIKHKRVISLKKDRHPKPPPPPPLLPFFFSPKGTLVFVFPPQQFGDLATRPSPMMLHRRPPVPDQRPMPVGLWPPTIRSTPTEAKTTIAARTLLERQLWPSSNATSAPIVTNHMPTRTFPVASLSSAMPFSRRALNLRCLCGRHPQRGHRPQQGDISSKDSSQPLHLCRAWFSPACVR